MDVRRVVVTGMGAVTPFGLGVAPLWKGLVEGRSGVSSVTLFDTTDFDVRIGGECRTFDPVECVGRKEAKRMDRFAQFALAACKEAVASSGFEVQQAGADRVAVIIGSGVGGLNELEQQHTRLMEKGPSKVSAFTIPKLMSNAGAGNISIQIGAKGESISVGSACASAANAMGAAMDQIRFGRADCVIAGGAEAAVTPLAVSAFASMKALSRRNDDPERASRPFDRDRDGFVLAEGAGVFVFEEFEHARRRGAPIFAEVIGYGATSDADHITQPAEDGQGAGRAMLRALADAGINPEDVDYINAHGTSTPLGDVAETRAIKRVFGEQSSRVVISSTKSCMGHSLGASGAIELIACIQSMRESVVPPTINLDHSDPACDLDYCPNVAREIPVRIAMTNSFGFGGHNACLVARRWE